MPSGKGAGNSMDPRQKEMLTSALQTFGKCDVIVKGESMKPFIRNGDTVSLSPWADVPRPGKSSPFSMGTNFWFIELSGGNTAGRVNGISGSGAIHPRECPAGFLRGNALVK